jgi:hypothetical protein
MKRLEFIKECLSIEAVKAFLGGYCLHKSVFGGLLFECTGHTVFLIIQNITEMNCLKTISPEVSQKHCSKASH